MKRIEITALLGIAALIATLVTATPALCWTTELNTNGIRVYSRQPAKFPFKEYRGIVVIDAKLEVLGEVLRQINRLDRSVKDLLVYARPKPPRYQRCDLPRAVERVLTLLRKEPEFERVRFEYSVPRNLPTIAADEHQIEQVLMNLLLNAAQASSTTGLVKLVVTPGRESVQIVVEDRGQGMTVDVARRAFEPFFTTKARGTGLGLPICRKIVEAHGGRISLRSTPGEGTAVTVELLERPPAVEAGAVDERSRTDR